MIETILVQYHECQIVFQAFLIISDDNNTHRTTTLMNKNTLIFNEKR